MRPSQLAYQDTCRIINKEQSFFYCEDAALALPGFIALGQNASRILWRRSRLLSWLDDTLGKRVWSAMRDVLTIGGNYCNRS